MYITFVKRLIIYICRYMVDRIRQLMAYKGLTSTQLADNIEVPRAIVSHILSGRNKPSLDVVLKIVSTYRDIDRDWLLLGEGDMLTNLAAAGQVKQHAPLAAEPAPLEEKEALQPATVAGKVQEAPAAAQVPSASGKAVEQVLVFYTDKTFETYKPS